MPMFTMPLSVSQPCITCHTTTLVACDGDTPATMGTVC